MNVQGEDKAGCSLGIHVCTESIVTKVGCQAIDVGLLLASSCRLVSGRVFCLMVGRQRASVLVFGSVFFLQAARGGRLAAFGSVCRLDCCR